jgi:hypothetical protein
VDEDRCLDVLVVPSTEVSHLDVAALDEMGHIIGRAAAAGRDRALVVCSPQKAPLTIEVRPHVGRGVAAIVLSRTPDGGSRDIDVRSLAFDLSPTGELSDTREKNSTQLDALGYQKAKLIGEGALQVGRRTSLSLDLPAGCARIDALAGRPVRGLEAWLWNADGALLARERGSGRATVFACTPGGKARLDVEALTLPGKYAVELRVEREVASLLLQHPLAASRLIARMQSRGVARSARQAGTPTAIALDTTKLERRQVLVPVGRCVDLSLALGPGASGAELRVVDSKNAEQLQLARGAHSTSTRVCALGRGELRATAEMQVAVGSTTALFATRMLAPRE